MEIVCSADSKPEVSNSCEKKGMHVIEHVHGFYYPYFNLGGDSESIGFVHPRIKTDSPAGRKKEVNLSVLRPNRQVHTDALLDRTFDTFGMRPGCIDELIELAAVYPKCEYQPELPIVALGTVIRAENQCYVPVLVRLEDRLALDIELISSTWSSHVGFVAAA